MLAIDVNRVHTVDGVPSGQFFPYSIGYTIHRTGVCPIEHTDQSFQQKPVLSQHVDQTIPVQVSTLCSNHSHDVRPVAAMTIDHKDFHPYKLLKRQEQDVDVQKTAFGSPGKPVRLHVVG